MPLHIDRELTIDQLPQDCIEDCSRGGQDAAPAVQHWRQTLGFTVDRVRAVECLSGYGAWERDELAAATDDELADKILWLACGSFSEWDGTEDSACGSDIFCLE